MFGLGAGELIIVALVFVLLFGSKRVPDLAQGIVDAIRHIRNAFSDDEKEDRRKDDDEKGNQQK